MLGGMNLRQFVAVLGAGAIVGFTPMVTAKAGDLTEEYNQARKIALKDPKVRAAFKKANDELDKRIIEIDPSLKPLIEKQRGTGKKAEPSNASAGKTHVVAQGETLSSIARRYHVSVESLVKANHISKQATLRIGQKLLIPART
jgi:LysM repeat protein